MTLLTEQQTAERALDKRYDDDIIAKVEGPSDDGRYTVTGEGGWTFGAFTIPDGFGAPKVGDTYRLYGGIGFSIYGGDLRGVPCWYKTKAERDAEHAAYQAGQDIAKAERWAANKETLLAEYAALPEGLRKRIDRFVANCPKDWWVEFGGYEMAALKTALAIYEAAIQADDPDAAVVAFYEMSYEEQKERVPVLDELGLSGNQFGYGCSVARQMLIPDEDERAKVLEWAHGAMVPLTGCEDYGCVPPPPGLFSDDDDTDEPPADEVAETEAILNDPEAVEALDSINAERAEAVEDAIRDAEAEQSEAGDPWEAATAEFEKKPIGALGKYVRDHTEMVAPGTEGSVSVHFFGVKAVREPSRTTLVDKINACLVEGEGEFTDFDRETFAKGQSYIALGAWIGSQEIALRLLGLGDHVGIWQCIRPALLGATGPDADQAAGAGYVLAAGYHPDGLDPALRMAEPEPTEETV